MEKNNELPKGWITTSLDSIAEIKNGFTFKSSTYKKSGIPLVRISNIQNQKIDLEKNIVFLSEENLKLKKEFKIFTGDILIALSGATTGKYGVFQHVNHALLNQRVGVIRTKYKKDIFQKFLLYFFGTLEDLILKKAYGMAQPNISTIFLKELEINISPINEQKRIIEKIEELFSKIDSTKQSLKHTTLQLEQYKQSVLESIFSKFEKKPLSNKAKITSGFSFKSKDFTDDGIPVIKISNIGYGNFMEKNQEFLPKHYLKEYADFVVKPKTILIALTRPITNNILKVCEYPENHPTGLLNQRVAKIELLENLDKKLSLFYFQSFDFKKQVIQYATGTEQPNLSPLKLADFLCPLTPLEKQEQISSQLEQCFSQIENSQNIVISALETLKTMKMSILKKAFEGKLIPQDPNDESASELLKRIKTK